MKVKYVRNYPDILFMGFIALKEIQIMMDEPRQDPNQELIRTTILNNRNYRTY